MRQGKGKAKGPKANEDRKTGKRTRERHRGRRKKDRYRKRRKKENFRRKENPMGVSREAGCKTRVSSFSCLKFFVFHLSIGFLPVFYLCCPACFFGLLLIVCFFFFCMSSSCFFVLLCCLLYLLICSCYLSRSFCIAKGDIECNIMLHSIS